jgi:hypothetical protein
MPPVGWTDHVLRCRQAMQALAQSRLNLTVDAADVFQWFWMNDPEWITVTPADARVYGDSELRALFHPACGWVALGNDRWSLTGEDEHAKAMAKIRGRRP